MTRREDSAPASEAARLEAQTRVEALQVHLDAMEGLPRRRVWWGIVVSLVLLLVGWWPTLGQMWLRWFPAWNQRQWSLWKRLSEGDSYYSHSPLVLLTCAVLAWYIHRRVGLPSHRSRGASVCGWMLLGMGLVLHVLSAAAGVMFASGFAFIGVLMGLLLIWGGWPMLGAYWIPVAMLGFAVPLPEVWIGGLNFRLKFMAGKAALWITTEVLGIPAVMNGSYVHLPAGPDGLPKILVVENVCGGLRSLISLVWFAALYAVVCRARGWWRLMIVAAAIPVAVACNIIRIAALNFVAHHWGVPAAAEGSTFHDFSGLAVFVIALAMLIALERVILWVGRRLGRNWGESRLMPYLDRIGSSGSTRSATWRWPVMACLAVAAALSLWWTPGKGDPHWGRTARNTVTQSLVLGATEFVGQDLELDARTLVILETNDYLYRRYTDVSTGRYVDLLIVFSGNNRKGTHPPEVCLEGSGENLVQRRTVQVKAPGVGPVVDGSLEMRELVTQKGAKQNYHLYVYKCGQRYTPDFATQQAAIFFRSLVSRSASGALVRLTTPIQRDAETARQMAMLAASKLLPLIDQELARSQGTNP